MLFPCGRSYRRTALTAMTIGGAAMLFLAAPSRGQQTLPTLRHTHPATRVRGAATPVSIDFVLPPRFQLLRNPRVRVVNAKNQLVELLPAYISARAGAATGHRSLHTEYYRPGVYRVSVELEYLDPRGTRGTAVSPVSTFTVPER